MNKDIAEHVLILEQYFKLQREMIELVNEQPENSFELNSYEVKVMEVEHESDRLSEELAESIRKIALIK